MTTNEMLLRSKRAAKEVALLSLQEKKNALNKMADSLSEHVEDVLRANGEDLKTSGLSPVMQDRLLLTKERVFAMAKGLRDVAEQVDPVGRVLETNETGNGLKIQKITVPFGVVAVIFESRPNVAADTAGLTLFSGNACVLRGGKESFSSVQAIVRALKEGLTAAGVNPDAVAAVDDPSRESANELMTAKGLVDLLIPRGGKGLIAACVEKATVPCIETGTGICHVYVDETADLKKALAVIENAKTSRPSVCNAEEVLLVHKNVAGEFLPKLKERLVDAREKAGLTPVRLLLSERARAYADGEKAGERDFDTEFLDYILAVDVVDGVKEAVAHIERHSTHHSDAILTSDEKSAAYFTKNVDSAAVYVNCSTRFTDGGVFGLGAEIGISTQKLHARGPMGANELTTYKYVIQGDGQIR